MDGTRAISTARKTVNSGETGRVKAVPRSAEGGEGGLGADPYKVAAAACACLLPLSMSGLQSWYARCVCAALFGECGQLAVVGLLAARCLPLAGLLADVVFGRHRAGAFVVPIGSLVLSHTLELVLGTLGVLAEEQRALLSLGVLSLFVVSSGTFLERRPSDSLEKVLENQLLMQNLLNGVFVVFAFHVVHSYLIMLKRKQVLVNLSYSGMALVSGGLVTVAFLHSRSQHQRIEHGLARCREVAPAAPAALAAPAAVSSDWRSNS